VQVVADVRFTGDDPSRDVFVGVAPTSAVSGYLSGTGTRRSRTSAPAARHPARLWSTGHSSRAEADLWVAKASGSGTQSPILTPSSGDWTIMVMNADGTPGVSVRTDASATVSALTWVAIGLIAGGLVLLAGSSVLIAVPVARASSSKTA
jgi:hypothetical protein